MVLYLQKRLGLSFLDSDLVIQERGVAFFMKLLKKEGLDGFNEIENQVNASIDVKKNNYCNWRKCSVWKGSYRKDLHEIGAVFT